MQVLKVKAVHFILEDSNKLTPKIGEYERLVRERDELLTQQGYDEDDPLIQDYNDQISRLEA